MLFTPFVIFIWHIYFPYNKQPFMIAYLHIHFFWLSWIYDMIVSCYPKTPSTKLMASTFSAITTSA